MAAKSWAAAEAKARFSELLQAAESAPQTIPRNGKEKAVLVSMEEWKHRTQPTESPADFFYNFSLRGSGSSSVSLSAPGLHTAP